MRTMSMISRRSTAALRYIRPTTFRVVSISNTISSMGEKPVDIAKLKEEKKRKKEEQKKLSQANKQQKQLPPPKPIQRSFCAIPSNAPLPDAVGTLTVMSFNILGQCLIKRQLFPDSGEMLKWKLRRTMVAQEMAMYNPDILCMQEMDNFDTFYKGELEKLGYKTELLQHPKKKHGIAIAYKSDLFTVVGYKTVDYDTDPLCPPTWKTGNIGQFLALQHNQHPQYGLVVGNTHLYWRPTAVYERVRQSMIYLRRLLELKNEVQEKIPGTQWIPFAIGDFNTTPDDPGYALLNNKSISEKDIEGLELSRKSPGSYMTVTSSSNNNNQEGGGSNGGETSIPQPPPPEAQEGGDEEVIGEAAAMTMPTSDLLQQLEQDRVGWQSVYSCYNEIDPAEADPEFGEPKFSNYTVSFKGTLDYMLLRPGLDPIMATELLKMPPQSLMEPSLPNRNFGSDHVCIATKIQFGGKKQQ